MDQLLLPRDREGQRELQALGGLDVPTVQPVRVQQDGDAADPAHGAEAHDVAVGGLARAGRPPIGERRLEAPVQVREGPHAGILT
ncbi:hypothetical protein ACU4GA_24185 [Methylobacterium oryzae CBMB20]